MVIRSGGARHGVVADINVTPMADIMIVLLIIFMMATPFLDQSPVPLPLARNAIERAEGEVKVVVTASGGISLGDGPSLGVEALGDYLRRRVQFSGQSVVVRVEADSGADYAHVARVFEACRGAGVTEIGLAARARVD